MAYNSEKRKYLINKDRWINHPLENVRDYSSFFLNIFLFLLLKYL